jgi:NAD(P)H-quinone oxidoreductase subunit 5
MVKKKLLFLEIYLILNTHKKFYHKLLIFYPDRPQAQLVAHKKFLLSRLADLCLLSAFVILGERHGSYHLHEVVALVESAGQLRAADHLSLVLVAFAMILISCTRFKVTELSVL